MPPEAGGDLAAQQALGAYIRDPERAPPPAGIEPRRLRIYADLFFNNVDGLLGTTFPVMRATLGDAWTRLVRDFLREHDARSPVFTELPKELLRYLDRREAEGRGDPPWLRELAHYEWIELALQVSEARLSDLAHDPDGDLAEGVPLLSPLAWPLAYDWPVHRIGPGSQPDAAEPTLLLVHRQDDGSVRFHELAPLAFHLLQRIESAPDTGRRLLATLAQEVGAPDVEALVGQGLALLAQYRRDGIVPGTRPA
ncbi:HvfC family RiPP maturation protein [Lysobacter xanthus]